MRITSIGNTFHHYISKRYNKNHYTFNHYYQLNVLVVILMWFREDIWCTLYITGVARAWYHLDFMFSLVTWSFQMRWLSSLICRPFLFWKKVEEVFIQSLNLTCCGFMVRIPKVVIHILEENRQFLRRCSCDFVSVRHNIFCLFWICLLDRFSAVGRQLFMIFKKKINSI